MRTIVLAGGGTAGHVTPIIALLPQITPHFDKICYLGSFDGIEKELVANYNNNLKDVNNSAHKKVEFYAVTTVKLRRSLSLKNLSIPFKLVKGTNEAKKFLNDLKPSLIFSKGGFVAYPVVRAAAKLKIPVIAHESDLTLGLANRLSAKHCKTICTTFETTASEVKSKVKDCKVIHTGSPIRPSIYSGNKSVIENRHFSLSEKTKQNLLVTGGSLGALRINEAIRGSLTDLTKKYNIVHICGKGKIDNTIKHSNYIQLEFVSDIENYFAWADVVVSRAGSNTLCELLALKKPTVFIPLATGRGDQIENAKEISKHDAAAVIYEENLTPQSLFEAINKAYTNREKYIKNTAKMGNLDGTKQIAELIISL